MSKASDIARMIVTESGILTEKEWESRVSEILEPTDTITLTAEEWRRLREFIEAAYVFMKHYEKLYPNGQTAYTNVRKAVSDINLGEDPKPHTIHPDGNYHL